MLHSTSLSFRNPLLFFSFSPPWQPGQGLHVPSVLVFQFAPIASRHCFIVWASKKPAAPQPQHNTATQTTWTIHRVAVGDVTTLFVWAKSSSCSFPVKMSERLVTIHLLLNLSAGRLIQPPLAIQPRYRWLIISTTITISHGKRVNRLVQHQNIIFRPVNLYIHIT